MHKPNPAFSGFFYKDHKRIDLVLVMSNIGNKKTQEKRINYLTNLIKFGLELELDQGKMSEHNHLTFVKIHAPDAIVEEYGIYFNLRKFFKDDHVEYINQIFDPIGMKYEKELIKLVREQYPGPVNYSTLERSKIVYNIILRLPYEPKDNDFGVNRLKQQNIILDVLALHDGPPFLATGQGSRVINGRQALFYNWTGIINIWRTQPVYMIQEYLGEEVALYFAYYEYFNIMLMCPGFLGLALAVYHYTETPTLDHIGWYMCHHYKNRYREICPQCRYFELCPFRLTPSYCAELQFISRIDTPKMVQYAVAISIWSILYILVWKRRDKYLAWMWEVNENYTDNLTNPEYRHELQPCSRSYLTGVALEKVNYRTLLTRLIVYILFVISFVSWIFAIFLLSIQIWYVKFHLNLKYNKNSDRKQRYNEHLFIFVGAIMYSTIVAGLRVVTTMWSHFLTALENNRTIGVYNRSYAFKIHAFNLTGAFALLTLHTFIGSFIYTHLLDMRNWYSVGGYRVMSNRLGSSLDDICITLGVAIVVEQIIVKIPSFLIRKKTDHEGMLNINAPSWEREYKLESIEDWSFHKLYSDIALQFMMATFFSLAFSVAPLIIVIMNVWDIKNKASIFLLSYRRPLLIKCPKPVVWHKVIFLTAFIVPVSNLLVVGLQSRYYLHAYEIMIPSIGRAMDYAYRQYYGITRGEEFSYFNSSLGYPNPKEEYQKLPKSVGADCYVTTQEHYFYRYKDGNHTFFAEYRALHLLVYKLEFILLYTMAGVSALMFIYFYFPIQSTDIEETQYTEARIKQKFYIQKGLVPQFE